MIPAFVFAVFVVAAVNVGYIPTVQAIRYGVQAEPNEFPYIVRIFSNRRFLMQGVYIEKGWVITGAFSSSYITPLRIEFSRRSLLSDEGVHYVTVNNNRNIFIHPQYDASSHLHSVALIKLPDDQIPNNIPTISLPSHMQCRRFPARPASAECTKVVMAGWGKTESGRLSNVLRKFDVRILSPPQWRAEFPDLVQKINLGNHICTTATSGPGGTMEGDGGAPLLCKSAGSWKILGQSTFGSRPVPARPILDVASNFCVERTWIQETIRKTFKGGDPSCGRRPTIRYGRLLPNRNPSQRATLMVECDYGYRLQGANVIYCINGSWTAPGTCYL